MAKEPAHLVDEFARAGADMITVHAEACVDMDRTLRLIHEKGCKAGIAINPATPVSLLEDVLELADMVLVDDSEPRIWGTEIYSLLHRKDPPVKEDGQKHGEKAGY